MKVFASDSDIPVHDTILIPYQHKKIIIDGNLDDWKTFYSHIFSDTCHAIHTAGNYNLTDVYPNDFIPENIPEPLSKNRVETNLCWNKTYLFASFQIFDQHLIAEFDADDDEGMLYLNDAIELYIDTRNDSKDIMDINDYQFIVDILNQSVVFRGNDRYAGNKSIAVPKEKGQNVLYSSAVSYLGIINDTNTIDSIFIVEMMIPFAAIGIEPYEGLIMKMDICNDDADRLLQELEMHPEDLYLTWPFNWSGIGDFGFPDRWKTVMLTGKPPVTEILATKYGLVFIFTGFFSMLVAIALIIFSHMKTKNLKTVSNKIVSQNLIVADHTRVYENAADSNNIILGKASGFIIKNPSLHISPQQLANSLHISLRTLQRLTKDELNCTPTVFISAVKLSMASEFLKTKQGNISQAAYDFGFSDPAYFSRLFKKHYGISPRDFIAKHKVA